MDNGEAVLVLEVGPARLGLRAEDVVAVVRAVAVTPLPGAAPGVDGIVDVHGTLAPVVDTRARLGFPTVPLACSQVFAVVRIGGRIAALRADGVVGLDAARPAGEVGGRTVARASDGVLIVADVAALVGDALVAAPEAAR